MKHANIAIFVPHAGCPQQCSFCDQRFISGERKKPTVQDVQNILDQVVKTLPDKVKPAQIAFFGGSFTAMSRGYMESLLEAAKPYIDGKNFFGIRISTRPDAIDGEILYVLEKYKVTDIEIGAQSMDNAVLKANLRGHTAEDTIKAASLIKQRKFGLGLQIMTGLYMDDTDITVRTAHEIVKLQPDCVRIYPTVVLRGTMLEKLFNEGKYRPQTLEAAVECCAGLLEIFVGVGIPVIRLGLHDSTDLSDNMLGGPHHPAFRELCESRILMRKTLFQIRERQIQVGNIFIKVRPDSISKMAGQKRINIDELKCMGFNARIVADNGIGYLESEVLQRM